eukprot:7382103-Prymnesium_polylepis.2
MFVLCRQTRGAPPRNSTCTVGLEAGCHFAWVTVSGSRGLRPLLCLRLGRETARSPALASMELVPWVAPPGASLPPPAVDPKSHMAESVGVPFQLSRSRHKPTRRRNLSSAAVRLGWPMKM